MDAHPDPTYNLPAHDSVHVHNLLDDSETGLLASPFDTGGLTQNCDPQIIPGDPNQPTARRRGSKTELHEDTKKSEQVSWNLLLNLVFHITNLRNRPIQASYIWDITFFRGIIPSNLYIILPTLSHTSWAPHHPQHAISALTPPPRYTSPTHISDPRWTQILCAGRRQFQTNFL
jgi:hypothetical protein